MGFWGFDLKFIKWIKSNGLLVLEFRRLSHLERNESFNLLNSIRCNNNSAARHSDWHQRQ